MEKKLNFLQMEIKAYKALQGIKGIPKFYWAGVEGDYNILVFQLLGESVEQLFQKYHKTFSLGTVFHLGQQMA